MMEDMHRPTFVFDGDCAFCSSCARFIENRIRPAAHVVAWQFTDLDALGLTEEQAGAAVQCVTAGRAPTAGPVAIADLLKTAPGVAGRLLWRPAGAVARAAAGLGPGLAGVPVGRPQPAPDARRHRGLRPAARPPRPRRPLNPAPAAEARAGRWSPPAAEARAAAGPVPSRAQTCAGR